MILCLDVGNTQVYGGVFDEGKLITQFRRTSQLQSSSDELGVFFRSVLRENGVDPSTIREIVICCVVPDLLYSLRACAQKYFETEPLVLRPGVKTGLKIAYRDPKEVGADRIADAIGAIKLFPDPPDCCRLWYSNNRLRNSVGSNLPWREYLARCAVVDGSA